MAKRSICTSETNSSEHKGTKCRKRSNLDQYAVAKTVSATELLQDIPYFNVSQHTERDWTHKKTDNKLNISSIIFYKTQYERRYVFEQLEKQIRYFTEPRLTKVKVFGKLHDIPRKQAAYGDAGVEYKYSGLTVPAIPWYQAPILELIRSHIEECTGIVYNFVLVNGKREIGS